MTQVFYKPPGSFVKHLIEGGYFPSHREQTAGEGHLTYWIDLTPLKLLSHPLTPFVEIPSLASERISPEKIIGMLELLKSIRRRQKCVYVVLVLGGRLEFPSPYFWSEMRRNQVAVLDRQVIDEVYNTRGFWPIAEILAGALVKSLGRSLLSPYAMGKPVSGSQFFGRRRALAKIANSIDENFTIYGIRQIGKTSLMHQVEHRLRLHDPQVNIARMYGSRFNRPEVFLTEMLNALTGDEREPSMRIFSTLPNDVSAIVRRSGRRVVVFVDEFDKILDLDRAESFRTVELLRETFTSNDTQIFFAGFRRVWDAALDEKHPLFNFTRSIKVERLSQDDSVKMIRDPARLLGIDLKRSELPERIYEETRGHPVLIQMFGDSIVERAAEVGGLGNPEELLNQVLLSNTFRDATFRSFLYHVTPYEKLVSYLLVERQLAQAENAEEFEFGHREVDDVLRSRGFSISEAELDSLMAHLETGGLIARVPSPGRFEFSVPQLAREMVNRDLDWGIRRAIEEVEAASDAEEALLGK